MSTDVKSMVFTDPARLVSFLDQNNLSSGDVINICPMNAGLVVFYTESSDTSPPKVYFNPPTSADSGIEVDLYFRASYASEVDPNVIGKVRIIGSGTWDDFSVWWEDPTLFRARIPRRYVTNPGFEFYLEVSDTEGNTTNIGTETSPVQVTVA